MNDLRKQNWIVKEILTNMQGVFMNTSWVHVIERETERDREIQSVLLIINEHLKQIVGERESKSFFLFSLKFESIRI